VVEVESKQRHRDNVESSGHDILERAIHVRVDLTVHESTEVKRARGEMQDMKGDKYDEKETSVEHRKRCRVSGSVGPNLIALRLRSPIEARERNSTQGVNDDRREKTNPHDPEDALSTEHLGAHSAKEHTVVIDLVIAGRGVDTGEYLQVARHMADHKKNERKATQGHGDLLADRCAIEITNETPNYFRLGNLPTTLQSTKLTARLFLSSLIVKIGATRPHV
jgi:hypothetical protein